MNLSNMDLNLFVVFDAIYTERNLTRAGAIIGITQPAVSNSLSRLRDMFDDPLFVRTAEGMMPTPVARNIVGSVRQALELMRLSIQESDLFNPKISDKRFRVSMMDLTQALVLPQISQKTIREAPLITVDCYQVRRRDMDIELASGNIDMAIDIPLASSTQVKQAPLFSFPYVCVVNEDNPLIGDELSLETYLSLRHIHISSRRGGLGQVDLLLGRLGKKRTIVLRTQRYLPTLQLLSQTNMALTIPKSFVDLLSTNLPIRYFELPFNAPKLELALYWHESTDKDQANQWMRSLLLTQAKSARQGLANATLPGGRNF